MKSKKKKKKKPYSYYPHLPVPAPVACKGKKGGCYWEGEPEGITKLRIAA